ncbi:MAG: foldase protein PrsA [Solirubrobacteraceae bacterium]|jgi:foldase protein PrsA|nr:foldase protein PrsA [Solirubrobacteraceae bacterium]
MKLSPRLLALCAFFVAAIALAACGGSSIPGNSVAKVGDTPITKTDFNHWLTIAATSSQGQGDPDIASGKKKAEIPDAPDFTKCIAAKKATAPAPAKGQPKPTDAQFKTQCQTEYNGLRDQVLQFLISAQWIVGESKDQGIKITNTEVDKQFATTKAQSFPKEADFQKFLKSSGMQLTDLKFRVKVQALSDKLRTKITKGKSTVTDAQVKAYYDKNKARFAQPQRRDLKVVLTKTKAKADQALAELKGGKSFKTVAKKYSIDQASKNQGGTLLAVAKGQQEKALDDAVFKAPKGKLEGPVKTQFGYYVFEVSKITPASQQTLTQATATIKQLLQSQNQQKALDSFVKDFQKRWKDKTNCRTGFVTQDCKNAPKPKTTSTVPATPTQSAPPANQGTTTSGG